ncbi:MAG TPA: valine--tRNA ligase [Firmicutes bacterium]|nr:valine--tRNA ligase [Bacillota bacterium]
MAKELAKVYDPKATEDSIYQFWMDHGCFDAQVDKDKRPYSIVMPPPNVTGQLHMGHAFDVALQDAIIRQKRMQGYEALWMPGMDHAGIATQIKVEEYLRENEHKTRYDLGREEFLKRVWQWKEQYGGRILDQQKKLGASPDWRRSRFTMDEGCSKAVREAFDNLYKKGLIYRGSRIINWCPHCATALSDTEVEYSEQAGHLWHIKYPVKETGEEIIIATTRPETILGDTGIAVNPEDERYTHLVGKHAILPLVGREIPIFADSYVEKDFGTGCVKVTPCHDPNDFEMGQRHGLEEILILDNDAKINENGGKYQGLDRYEARKAILADLEACGALVKTEEYSHNVGACYRCGTTVEPVTSAQWFVKMEPLAKEAIRVVKEGRIKFVPERFTKIYMNWMENVHDWCISRQLWWGHRIPAWYCDECGHITVAKEDPSCCEHCGSTHIHQEEDVLDTWFSSGLWPFSTMGWPEQTPELAYFYPTDVLVTGYDIIFFWVARMVCMAMAEMGEVPFKTVYIHGLVRDGQGRKMSKSLGNGIDPIEIIDQYGADALRFTLYTGNSPGNDTRFSAEKVEASRNFCNKIWNASRYVLMNLDIEEEGLPQHLTVDDKWILSRYNDLVKEVTENMDRYELGIAAEKLYSFIWDTYCDWYIELTKPRLQNKEDQAAREGAQRVLSYVLSGTMQLLHPFMPFLTETIWQALPHQGDSIMRSAWPTWKPELCFEAEEQQMEDLMEVIRAIRNRRSEMNVPPSKKAQLLFAGDKADQFVAMAPLLERLAYGSHVAVVQPGADLSGTVSVVTGPATVYIPLSELVDLEKEKARLQGEKDKAEQNLQRILGKLQNESFVSKAPAHVVEAEREKAEKARQLIAKLEENLKNMK